MRNSILLFGAVVALSALVSCAGTPVAETAVSESSDSDDAVSAADADSGPRSIWKPEVTVVKYIDGTVDKTIVRTYDADGRILRLTETDGRGLIILEQEFDYVRGFLENEKMYDNSGLISVTTYILRPDGLPEKQVKTDPEGNVVSGLSYIYSDEILVSTVAEDEKGIPLLVIEYSYDGDILSSAEYKLPAGESDGRFERSIENGLVTGEKTVLPDGTVTSSRMFNYTGDRIIEEIHFAGSKRFKSAGFEYDDSGNVIREVWSDGSGSEYEIIERSWLQFEGIK